MDNLYNFKDIKAMQEANDRLLQELERNQRQGNQLFGGVFPPSDDTKLPDDVHGTVLSSKEDCSCKHS